LPLTRLALPFLLLALTTTSVQAERWELCPPQQPLPQTRLTGELKPGATDAVADDVAAEGTTHVLTGNVELRQGQRWVGADRIEIDRRDRIANAEGNVYLRTNEYAIFTPRGAINMNTGAFDVEDPHLLYHASRAVRDEAGIATLSDGTWSTCPEDDEDWVLRAREIRLNPNNRQGTARDASLWFQGAPLLYTPYFRFPLGDARLSGFLNPRIGSSSDSGTEVVLPWYWNIAPNFDATLTPRSLSKRGVQLQTETRWLSRSAGFWQFDLHHLPEDRVFEDDRTLTRLQQDGSYGYGLRTDLDLAGVSDDEYFEDLGNPLKIGNPDHVESRADVYWNSGLGSSRLRLQSFDTVDETIAPQSRPYKQLPQITHRWQTYNPAFGADLDAELVSFDRDRSDTATRLRLVPAITRELETPGWFFRPRLAWDYTAFDIDRVTTTGDERIERSLPVLSLDSGLVFERFGSSFRQTLEPRAFYVYIPDEDQDDIPLFDTGELTFSFAQLFRERRFTGGDRVGDANRLSLALTSRLLSRQRGDEVLRGSIGVIHHFEDRDVTLRSGPAETEDLSDVIGEIAARPNEYWRASATAQWNPEQERTERHDSRIAFRGPGGGIANFAYRRQRDTREQVDVSLAWPVSPRWTLFGRKVYSLRDREDKDPSFEPNIDGLVGFEYESCCWRFRVLAREFIDEADAATTGEEVELDESVYFELVFKGLGGAGDEAGELFEDAILGYQDPSKQNLP